MPEPTEKLTSSINSWQNTKNKETGDDCSEDEDDDEGDNKTNDLHELFGSDQNELNTFAMNKNDTNDELFIKPNKIKIIKKSAKDKNSAPNSGRKLQKKRFGNTLVSQSARISNDRLKELRKIVDYAAQHHKTFTIFGKYPSIKEALKNRGWVQNYDMQKLTLPKRKHDDDGYSKHIGASKIVHANAETERLVITRMLRQTAVNFIWTTSENINWNNIHKNTLVSRFPRVYFTTKIGICNYLENSHWFFENGIAQARFPRCYIITNMDDIEACTRDFRLTACISMLRRVVNSINVGNANYIFSDKGQIPLRALGFAAKRCGEFIYHAEHEDIDIETEEKIWNHQWDQFLTYYYQLVHDREVFESATVTQLKEIYDCCKLILTSLKDCWPQMDLDGTNNLWIIKPGAKSRGRGIVILSKLEDIIKHVHSLSSNEPKYVVQKYIEKPFLVHNTKFDIRQWFLVTSAYPLTIWIYKESYLRFCSQLFSLNNTHESIHLSNNAIQSKYENAKRDGALPDENMWDCYTFQAYLRTIGKADIWDSVIYPGMRENITCALLASQEHIQHRKNCFELYGADFMLTEDLVPWLIEINSSPCMAPTTSVTARMCSQCLEDVIKVVIDRRHNKDADTGMFELAYKQQVSQPQPYMGMNFTVRGFRMLRFSKKEQSPLPGPENLEKIKDLGSPKIREAIQRLSEQLCISASGSTNCSPLLTTSEKILNKNLKSPKMIITSDGTKATSSAVSKVSSSVVSKLAASGLTRLSVSSSSAFSKMHKVNQEKKSYKKHCCINKSNVCQSVVKLKLNKNSDNVANLNKNNDKQCSTNQNGKAHSINTVQIPQVNHLIDWKKRVERTKANCEITLSKFKNDKNLSEMSPSKSLSNKKLPAVVKENKVSIERKSPLLNKYTKLSNLPDIKKNAPREINNNIPLMFTAYDFVKPINTITS